MIRFVSGISTAIPSRYDEIIRRLRMLGLSPTGNPELDKSRLQAEINRRVEKVEEVKKNRKGPRRNGYWKTIRRRTTWRKKTSWIQ